MIHLRQVIIQLLIGVHVLVLLLPLYRHVDSLVVVFEAQSISRGLPDGFDLAIGFALVGDASVGVLKELLVVAAFLDLLIS